jgi:ketosteroid isomerase-like protein
MRTRSFLVLAVITACSGGESTDQMPVPELSRAAIEQLDSDATSFAERHMGVWPDVDAFVANYADDAIFADPTWSDFRAGNDNLSAMLKTWAAYTDFTYEMTGTYVSVDGAAYEETWYGLLPPLPPLPEPPPVTRGLEVYKFRDGQAIVNDMWYPPEDNEMFGLGCFAVDGCPAFWDTVDRYVDAWSSRDSGEVADLYSPDTRFTDSIVGLEVSGADGVGRLAERRFGSVGDLSITVLGTYAWTDGIYPPTEADPDRGTLLGVAIHYRVDVVVDGMTWVQEAITTLELGDRDAEGVDADPERLIHTEEVFHEPATLLASGPTAEPAVNATCLADMYTAGRVPDLEQNLAERNQELWPTFGSCTSTGEWEAAAVAAGVRIGLEHVPVECGLNPGVADTPLCRALPVSQD